MPGSVAGASFPRLSSLPSSETRSFVVFGRSGVVQQGMFYVFMYVLHSSSSFSSLPLYSSSRLSFLDVMF